MPTLTVKPYPNSNFLIHRRNGNSGVVFTAFNAANLGDGVAGSAVFATNWTEQQSSNLNSGTPSYKVSRTPMAFDTSSLPDNTTIFSATLTLYMNAPSDFDYFQAQNFSDARVWPLRLVEGTYPFNGPINQTHFGSTVRSHLIGSGNSGDIVTISTSLRSVTINLTDLSFINKTGPTRFMLLANADYLLTAPAYSSSEFMLTMYNAQDLVTAQRAPELTIVHQVVDVPTICSYVG